MLDFTLQILLGILLADFLSGVIHWIQDRYATPLWPVVGKAVEDAHDHHVLPFQFLEKTLMQRNGVTMALVATIGAVIGIICGYSHIWAAALITGFFANEIHATTHRGNRVPSWVKGLRFVGLIQSPAHHARHHAREDRSYCVITSWLNPALDHIKFWQGLEWILFVLAVWPKPETPPQRR
jgi:ubiquitin-conjugating enzyme E2 variant